MIFSLNFKSGLPVYLQVVDQVRAAAASGALKPGEPLPFIRPLAEELRVNRNTIAKAYSELESQGIIETVQGKGCFLAPNHSPLKKEIRRQLLIKDIDQAVVQAHHLQVPPAELLELVRGRLAAMAERKRTHDQPPRLTEPPTPSAPSHEPNLSGPRHRNQAPVPCLRPRRRGR